MNWISGWKTGYSVTLDFWQYSFYFAYTLDIPINEDKWDDILLHCSFDYMKANASRGVPLGGAFWDGGAKTFIHKGTNGRWRDVLSKDQILQYELRAAQELGEDCARWLEAGEN